MKYVNESQMRMAFERIVKEKLSCHPELMKKYLSRGFRVGNIWFWEMSDVEEYLRAVKKAG